VGITITDAQAGDFFALSNITGTGFTIKVKNRSTSGTETFVSRTFTFSAVGFGKGV
jgi:hypothetical protein